MEGHAEKEIKYSYAIVEDTSGGAILTGDKLKCTKEGTIIIKATTIVNGLTRTSLKTFEIEK